MTIKHNASTVNYINYNAKPVYVVDYIRSGIRTTVFNRFQWVTSTNQAVWATSNTSSSISYISSKVYGSIYFPTNSRLVQINNGLRNIILGLSLHFRWYDTNVPSKSDASNVIVLTLEVLTNLTSYPVDPYGRRIRTSSVTKTITLSDGDTQWYSMDITLPSDWVSLLNLSSTIDIFRIGVSLANSPSQIEMEYGGIFLWLDVKEYKLV